MLNRFETTLLRFNRRSRLRELSLPQGKPFATNDYLALANSAELKQAAHVALDRNISVGAGSSRLISGNSAIFAELEAYAADYFNCEKALFFNCGYMANLAVFTTLPHHDDYVLYDEFVHASMIDGIRAGKAQSMSFKHQDLHDLVAKLKEYYRLKRGGRIWIAVESLYSMDGDTAPLEAIIQIANQYEAFVVIDEAHATGVYGKHGEGLLAASASNIISIHTCGKALGVSGAIVGLNAVFHAYLVNRARTFIYTTAPSPLIAAVVLEALVICRSKCEYRTELHALMNYANQQFQTRFQIKTTYSQIIPVIIKSSQQALRIAQVLRIAGFDTKAIRPPTVPEGSARLRLSITRHVTNNDIDALFDALTPFMENLS